MRCVRFWGPGLFCFLLAALAAPGIEAQARRAVLDRGNVWVQGVPGFADQSLSALYGEYRLEFSPTKQIGMDRPTGMDTPAGRAGVAEARRCRVWLTGEALPFAGDWQPRTRFSAVAVSQRQEGDAVLAGFSFGGGTGLGSWTAVFQFPAGAAAVLDEPGANALMARWLDRFRYFLALIKNPADVSLPAVFTF
jgi:hypothetical protein